MHAAAENETKGETNGEANDIVAQTVNDEAKDKPSKAKGPKDEKTKNAKNEKPKKANKAKDSKGDVEDAKDESESDEGFDEAATVKAGVSKAATIRWERNVNALDLSFTRPPGVRFGDFAIGRAALGGRSMLQ